MSIGKLTKSLLNTIAFVQFITTAQQLLGAAKYFNDIDQTENIKEGAKNVLIRFCLGEYFFMLLHVNSVWIL